MHFSLLPRFVVSCRWVVLLRCDYARRFRLLCALFSGLLRIFVLLDSLFNRDALKLSLTFGFLTLDIFMCSEVLDVFGMVIGLVGLRLRRGMELLCVTLSQDYIEQRQEFTNLRDAKRTLQVTH